MGVNKKVVCAVLAVAAVCALAACSGGSVNSNLTGTPEEILKKLMEDISASDSPLVGYTDPEAITADKSWGIGLFEADFNKYVTAVSASGAAINTSPNQIVVIQAKDAKSAAEVKKLTTLTPDDPDDGGYNPKKWVCVMPAKVVVVESGNYILIVSSSVGVVDAAVAAFKTAAGEIGSVNTIWELAAQ